MKVFVESTPEALTKVHITGVDLPPSVNKIYRSIGKGRRALTAEGKAYKRKVIDALIPELCTCPPFKENEPLHLSITLHLKALLNKGWPKKTKKRYKRIDVSNRIKLLEDALFECLGVDDCNVISLKINKVQSAQECSHVELTIRSCDD
jgi:Holliday junction resolvase RusA-like endonuclease